MPVCKFCQQPVGIVEGGLWARMHPSCSMDFAAHDDADRQAFLSLTRDEQVEYAGLAHDGRAVLLVEVERRRGAELVEAERRRRAEKAKRTRDRRREERVEEEARDRDLREQDSERRRKGNERRIVSALTPEEKRAFNSLDQRGRDKFVNAKMEEARVISRWTDDAAAAALGRASRKAFMGAFDEQGWSRRASDDILLSGFLRAVAQGIKREPLSRKRRQSLVAYLDDIRSRGVPAGAIGSSISFEVFARAAILRDALDGDVSELIARPEWQVEESPFNLLKSEDLVWVFRDARYYQTKTVREFRGSSHGVSVRVAKGLYYRPSAFKGRSVSREETVHADTGMLGVTTKHLYFHGERERFRVRFDRIVSFEPFSDGLGVMRDNQRAKPESFVTGDGWFIYNLVTNLSQM